MRLGTLDIIKSDGTAADSLAPFIPFNPTTRGFTEALWAFIGKRLTQGRATTLYMSDVRHRTEWFDDLVAVRMGTRGHASLLIPAVLDGLHGGVLITATIPDGGRSFVFDFSTHT